MDVLMPQLGETVAEGKITQWFKTAGDLVKPGDNLFEIETDKVSMEVPATAAGVLAEIRVAAGEVAPVGAVVAVIADGAGAAAPKQASASAAAPSASQPASAVSAAAAGNFATPIARPIELDPFFEVRTPARNYGPARLAGGRSVTPLARRLAAEGGIDLARISPSGPHGRIVARDVEAAGRTTATAPPRSTIAAASAEDLSADAVTAIYRDVPLREVPLDGMRRAIANRLAQAKQTIPHFYLTADVEIARLIALREEANAAAPKDKDGNPAFKFSVNDLLIKAWAAARAGGECSVGAGSHPALAAFRHCRRRRAGGRLDRAGDPAGGVENPLRDLERDEGAGGAGADEEAQSERIRGRFVHHFQSRY